MHKICPTLSFCIFNPNFFAKNVVQISLKNIIKLQKKNDKNSFKNVFLDFWSSIFHGIWKLMIQFAYWSSSLIIKSKQSLSNKKN